MHPFALLLTALVMTSQEKPTAKAPAKGDTIIVRGCLSGSALESTETRIVDATDRTGRRSSAVTFRLTGDKDLLKQLRKDHDKTIVEVTGVLKSNLPQTDGGHVAQVGKTRISVGVRTPQTSQPHDPPYRPNLEVKSYEGLGSMCAG